MNYVIFESEGQPTTNQQTTTRWGDDIIASIPLSGEIDGIYYNLMKMEGSISNWLAENESKVRKVTKAEINELGQRLVPEGTTIEYVIPETGEQKTAIAGVFDIDNPDDLWVEL